MQLKSKAELRQRNLQIGHAEAMGAADPEGLAYWTGEFGLDLEAGELALYDKRWQPTTSGLLAIARRAGCMGISTDVLSMSSSCEVVVVRATVYRSAACRGISALGQAETSTVPQGMEHSLLSVAETRAINRAIRRAYLAGTRTGTLRHSTRGEVPCGKKPVHSESELPLLPRSLEDIVVREQLDPTSVHRYALACLERRHLQDCPPDLLQEFIAQLEQRLQSNRDAFLRELASFAPEPRVS
jgi:hypothetical protein